MSSLIKYGNSLLKPFPNIDSESLNEICNKCKFDVNHALSLTNYIITCSSGRADEQEEVSGKRFTVLTSNSLKVFRFFVIL